MSKRRSELADACIAVSGADREFAAETCVHLAGLGARLLLMGGDSDRLHEVDAALAQSELHRVALATERDGIRAALDEHNLTPSAVVLFCSSAPDHAGVRAVLEPFAERANGRPVNALVVLAARPPGLATANPLPDLALASIHICWLEARNVVSPQLLAELGALASDGAPSADARLAALFGGLIPNPPLSSRHLGPIVETLLGSFTRFAQGRHYVFDGARPIR